MASPSHPVPNREAWFHGLRAASHKLPFAVSAEHMIRNQGLWDPVAARSLRGGGPWPSCATPPRGGCRPRVRPGFAQAYVPLEQMKRMSRNFNVSACVRLQRVTGGQCWVNERPENPGGNFENLPDPSVLGPPSTGLLGHVGHRDSPLNYSRNFHRSCDRC